MVIGRLEDLPEKFSELTNHHAELFRSYTKEFKIPEGVQVDQISSSYSAAGILTVEAPRVLTAPEGASVQEAMAAKSKAYTTDDGRTAVKEDSSASSQVRRKRRITGKKPSSDTHSQRGL